MTRNKDYNWLDDPFDEKKNAEQDRQGMSAGSRLAVLFGCLGVVILVGVVVFSFGMYFLVATGAMR